MTSEMHTKGPLSTPGWLPTYAYVPIIAASGVSVGTCHRPSHSQSAYEECEANARRLVAAWNACQGIPTEMLEEGPLIYAPDAMAKEQKARADALAARLEEAEGLLRALVDDMTTLQGVFERYAPAYGFTKGDSANIAAARAFLEAKP